jgi:hypothetical protein
MTTVNITINAAPEPPKEPRFSRLWRALTRILRNVLLLVTVSFGIVSTSPAKLSFEHAGFDLTQADGTFSRQAGAHPDLTVSFGLPIDDTSVNDGRVSSGPVESVRDVDVDLPVGMVGNPTSLATCDPIRLANPGGGGSNCPVASQIGVVDGVASDFGSLDVFKVAIYNIAHGPDVPARFGFNYRSTVATIDARVRPGDYGISSGSFSISQALAVESVKLTLWGVPADPSHDTYRQPAGIGAITCTSPTDPSCPRISTEAPVTPFLSTPTSCSATPSTFTMRGDSWEVPGVFDTQARTADEDGTPFIFDGCERLAFNPTVDVAPLSRVADAPTGINVDVKVPQSDDANGLSTAHVKRVVMTLPKGVSVSPSSAAGLGACAPSLIGLGTNDAPRCPDSSKLGTVRIDTPVLPDPLTGDIILAQQNNNPFGSLIALYIAVKGPGFYVKLPGKIDLDPTTGQVTATFDNTPQLPFSRLQVNFQGGSQAALATPPTCGTYNTHIDVTSWASPTPVSLNSPMTIDQGCGAAAFAPSFTAGMTNPLAGQNSPFVFTLTRADRTPYLANISTALPAGLLANIASVTQCAAGQAAAGNCPAASEVGSTAVQSGPGAQPLALLGHVYLTGPYSNPATGQNAPFGLSIVVPTAGQAGPFDLGPVVVRAGIYVDRSDAHVTVKSDPLPTIIQGIPLRLRQVIVNIDRPKFMFNPTSCAASSVFGSFGALGGAVSNQAVKFQPGGCGDLDLKQKLALKFTGKSSTKDGSHPGVDATLTDPGGGANLDKAEVKLPLSVALDPDNAQALCKPLQRLALSCPKASIVGTATAVSVLPHPLTGPVYFVEGTRKSASGRTISTLPKLWIPLSGDGVTIDVNADSDVDSIKRLVTTFHDIPDAPIKQFSLKINGGKHGILVVSGNPGTCDRDKTIDSRFTGQNGEVKVSTTQVKVDGCKPTVKKTKVSSKAVTLSVDNLGSGKLTLAGGVMVSRSSRTLKGATKATITAKLTNKARTALRRDGKVKLSLSVGFRPKGGKAVTVTKALTVRR